MGMEFDPIKFKNFIVDKFDDWRGKSRPPLTAYAKEIGVSGQVMSNWYLGKLKRRPEPETYLLLVAAYGPEVYDALNLPRPAAQDFANRLEAALREAFTLMIERGIKPGTPEADSLIAEISDKFGVDSTNISK